MNELYIEGTNVKVSSVVWVSMVILALITIPGTVAWYGFGIHDEFVEAMGRLFLMLTGFLYGILGMVYFVERRKKE